MLNRKLIYNFLLVAFVSTCLLSCNKQITSGRVYVSKKAQEQFTNAEQFVQNHFKEYNVPDSVLFEFHIIYFNNDAAFTVSKLGAYQSVAELAADRKLLRQITENKKESYTGYVMLRNYDLYKEIEILDENDVLFYFPDAAKMLTDNKTRTYYELDLFMTENAADLANANAGNLTLLGIPVEANNLQFDKLVNFGSGAALEAIVINAFDKNMPFLDNAIYLELEPDNLLQKYKVVNLYNTVWSVRNYLSANKLNADVTDILKNLKAQQSKLSDEFADINKNLISLSDNEKKLNEMLTEILNKIDNK